jgi:transcriptional regulator with XRE-family HTH domain
MPKPVFSKPYKVFLQHFRDVRRGAGLTQEEVARRTKYTQSFISKCERGERRIDIIELMQFCRAFGIAPAAFVRGLESKMKTHERASRR